MAKEMSSSFNHKLKLVNINGGLIQASSIQTKTQTLNLIQSLSATKRNRKLHLGHAWDVTLQDDYPSKNVCRVRYFYGYQGWTMRDHNSSKVEEKITR